MLKRKECYHTRQVTGVGDKQRNLLENRATVVLHFSYENVRRSVARDFFVNRQHFYLKKIANDPDAQQVSHGAVGEPASFPLEKDCK